MEKRIDYTIRFQNTGNDTAIHIVIADTLSSKLQANSLQIIATSHDCKTSIKDGVVFFEMRNIMLPDSNVNKLKSNGFIRFTMLPQSSVVAGDNIPNSAAIYFDYNKPVITNTAHTLIKNVLPVKITNYQLRIKNDANIPLLGGVWGGLIENTWATANEINLSHFVVQRSADGKVFKSVGSVAAKGNSFYSFIDELKTKDQLPKTLYYRLQSIDKDGKYSFSDVRQVSFVNQQSVKIYPNPAKNSVTISCSNAKEISIINNIGITIKQFSNSNSPIVFNTQHLAKGFYVVKIITINGETKTEKLLVE